MPHITVASFYIGLIGIILLVLSRRIIRLRHAGRVSLGDGGDPHLLRAIRAHANFVEYAPIGAIYLVVMALVNTPAPLIHLLGAAFVTGRVLHAIGLSRLQEVNRLRVAGMVLTLGSISATSVGLIINALWQVI